MSGRRAREQRAQERGTGVVLHAGTLRWVSEQLLRAAQAKEALAQVHPVAHERQRLLGGVIEAVQAVAAELAGVAEHLERQLAEGAPAVRERAGLVTPAGEEGPGGREDGSGREISLVEG